MKKVAILMSTYNGEKYLEEQLDSLEKLDRQELEIDINIRDDGSNDNTIEILERYSKKNLNITWYQGENKGPAYSFLELLSKQTKYDYYAFCDQDDVWETSKIVEAIKKIDKFSEKPALYFSAVNLVDKELNFISKKKLEINLSLETSFMLNPAIGCTLVMNNRLKEIITKSIPEGEIGMHDSWTYRIAQSIGAKVVYDDNAYIKYRQHDNNVMGIKANKNLCEKMSYFTTKRKRVIGSVAKLILENYEQEIEKDKKKVLQDIVKLSEEHTLKSKFNIIINKGFKSTSHKENIKFKYDVVFNRI